jgi:hypothetical protein
VGLSKKRIATNNTLSGAVAVVKGLTKRRKLLKNTAAVALQRQVRARTQPFVQDKKVAIATVLARRQCLPVVQRIGWGKSVSYVGQTPLGQRAFMTPEPQAMLWSCTISRYW